MKRSWNLSVPEELAGTCKSAPRKNAVKGAIRRKAEVPCARYALRQPARVIMQTRTRFITVPSMPEAMAAKLRAMPLCTVNQLLIISGTGTHSKNAPEIPWAIPAMYHMPRR